MTTLKTVQKANPAMNHCELVTFLESMPKRLTSIVEIGVHMGGSFKVWRDHFKPKLLIGVDHDEPASLELKNNLGPREHLLTPRDSGSSEVFDEVVDLLRGRNLGFLFIDGDHSYLAVKRDFEIYSELCGVGSVIAFHDINVEARNPNKADEINVKKFWDEIKQNHEYKEFCCDEDGATGIGAIYL